MKLSKLLLLFLLIILILALVVIIVSPLFERPYARREPMYNFPDPDVQANNTSDRVNKSMPIRIATWNIQNFGQSKTNSPEVMKKIAAILKDYDIIAVQEISNIREQSDSGCPRNEGDCPGAKECGMIGNALEQYLNVEYGRNYHFTFSEQVYDERYLFIWDPDSVTLEESKIMLDSEGYIPICDTIPTDTGRMIRQPFYGKFKAGNREFALLTAHTSPDSNLKELEGLLYFYNSAEQLITEVILLGDLNADCSYLKANDSIALRGQDYVWLVPDDADTTVAASDCAYDRIIYRKASSNSFAGEWGIEKNITSDMSDHYLVWAEFG